MEYFNRTFEKISTKRERGISKPLSIWFYNFCLQKDTSWNFKIYWKFEAYIRHMHIMYSRFLIYINGETYCRLYLSVSLSSLSICMYSYVYIIDLIDVLNLLISFFYDWNQFWFDCLLYSLLLFTPIYNSIRAKKPCAVSWFLSKSYIVRYHRVINLDRLFILSIHFVFRKVQQTSLIYYLFLPVQ